MKRKMGVGGGGERQGENSKTLLNNIFYKDCSLSIQKPNS